MTAIETRLRAALRDLGEEVPPSGVPPLALPATQGGRARRLRWLAPLAAAAAVLAVVAALAVTAGLSRGTRPVTGRSGRVPPFYIAVTGTRPPYAAHPFVAGIYATADGALLARIPAPGAGTTVAKVSAAADDRTFAIAVEAAGPVSQPAVRFYLVRFDAVTDSVRITALAQAGVPAGAPFDGFALSPDGRKLAVAFEVGQFGEKLQVLTIATGQVRTWTSAHGHVAGDTADPWSLSWSADSRTLAINWYGVSGTSTGLLPGSGLRLLDTAGPGSDLVANSRLALRMFTKNGSQATSAGYLSDIAMLTPDGQTIVAAISAFSGPKAGFAYFSATTGQLEQIADFRAARRGLGGPMDVLWASPSGGVLVVYAPPGHPNRIGILRGGRLRLLPQSVKIEFPAAAW